MSTQIIVSYDGTPNDDDALALGRMLSRGGASLALAYVRHSREFDPRREELAQHDANRRLLQGATWLGDPEIPRHVVVHASTWEGLAELTASEGASLIVFGSDYRTSPGRVAPGTTAQHLLEGGPVAIAVAPAGLRTQPDLAIQSIAADATEPDSAAEQTARVLAEKLGASVTTNGSGPAELTVIAAQAGTSAGKLRLGGAARNRLDSIRGAVLFLPAGAPLQL